MQFGLVYFYMRWSVCYLGWSTWNFHGIKCLHSLDELCFEQSLWHSLWKKSDGGVKKYDGATAALVTNKSYGHKLKRQTVIICTAYNTIDTLSTAVTCDLVVFAKVLWRKISSNNNLSHTRYCHLLSENAYLIFVISFTRAGFSKTKFYTQKKTTKRHKKH